MSKLFKIDEPIKSSNFCIPPPHTPPPPMTETCVFRNIYTKLSKKKKKSVTNKVVIPQKTK
jgi:hypothetical protein